MNRKNGKRIILVSIVLLAMVISGFSVMTTAAAPQPATRANSGVLKIAMQQDMPNFNYFDLNSNTVWKSDVIGWNFESIMGMDEDGSAYPMLAKKVTFDEKTLTATIYLRHNVTFQDGTPMTAKDVVFSYCALRQGTTVSGTTFTVPFDDNNNGVVSFSEIKNHVKYVNQYEVQISTRQPYSYFFLGTLGLPIIPEHIWAKHLVSVKGQSTSVDSEGYTAGIVNVAWNDNPEATIGTGSWMYAGGVKDSYRIEKPYSGYWGKDFKTPDGYPFWNPNVTEMYFKVYANLDTAALALQSGEVDYIAWAIQPGKIPEMQQNPNIKLHFAADNGYFYLAFNEKTEPANYIAFRHAVSHVIDKNIAVQRYLGGYGKAGDSTEPPFFTAWYNASVQHYPYDLNTAKNILNGQKVVASNGFVEQDPAWNEKFPIGPSGWRTLPDGSPMKPITLFTPPADYDPVRIKVGQGIAQNLRGLGVNIQAKAVDFDTLVAYMQSYNYQMLELGWSLSSDPIGNLADILGPQSIQNTYGWWNASNPNPYYKNAGGVSNTLADSQSQAYATEFGKVINNAMTTFNVTKQIKYTKWAQGIVAKAVVVNVLYYKLNVEATRTDWSGWIDWQGSVFNGLSLGELHRGAGPAPPAPTPGQKTMELSLNVPGRVLINGNGTGRLFVMDNTGAPVANAHVAFSANSSVISVTPSTGTTNANGVLEFTIHGSGAGMTLLKASVSKQGYTMVNGTATVQVVNSLTPVLTATATASKMVLSPGGTSTVTVTVVDQNGKPVSGATVSVNPNVVGFGKVSPFSATTDSSGKATFTYTGTSATDMQTKYANMHTIGKLVFSVSKKGYMESNTPVLQLVTYNKNPSKWSIFRIEDVSQYAVSSTLGWNTTITIRAIGADGNGLANANVPVYYSNTSYIKSGPNAVVTNATGYATFNVSFNTGLATAPIYIEFVNKSVTNSVADRLDVLYYNGNMTKPLYGGVIDIANAFINGSSSFTVHLYNQYNKPVASNVSGAGPISAVIYINNSTNVTVSGNLTVTVKNPVISNGALVGGTILVSNLNGKVVKSSNSTYVGKAVNGKICCGVIAENALSGEFNGTIGSENVSANMSGSTSLAVNMSTVVPVAAVVSGTTDGQMVDLDDESNNGGWFFNSAWYYTGIGIYSPYDNIATSGDFIGHANRTANPYDGGLSTWDETGVQSALVANGTLTIGLPLSMESYRDLMFNVFIVPYGDVYLYISDPSWYFYQFNITGQQVFESQAVVSRAMNILVPQISTDNIATPGQPFAVHATVYNQDNTPLPGVSVTAYNNAFASHAKYPSVSGTTDKNGTVTLTPWAPNGSAPTVVNVFVKAAGGPNTYSVLQSTTIAVVPPYMFVTIMPENNAVTLGGTVAFVVDVTDSSGNPISGASVQISPSMGTANPSTVVTAPDGQAVFVLDTSSINAANLTSVINSVTVSVVGLMDDYNPASASGGVILLKGYSPILSVGLASGSTVVSGYTLKGYVYDTGTVNVTLNIDNNATAHTATVVKLNTTMVMNGVTYNEYQWSYKLTGLSSGNHTVKVTVTDSNGITTVKTVPFSVASSSTSGTTTTSPSAGVGPIYLWAIIVILIIVIIIMGVALAKKPKTAVPEEEEPTEPTSEEEEPAEEETPEESAEEESEEGGEE